MNIIQKVSQYHMLPIDEATNNSDLSVTITRITHKTAKAKSDAAALEK